HENNGNLVIRNTRDVAIDNVIMTGCDKKNINTAFVDGVRMSNITVRNASGGVDGVGVYIGHFDRNASLINYVFDSPSPVEEFIKISHYATRTTITNCTLKGTGYIMIQGAQSLSMSNVNLQTS